MAKAGSVIIITTSRGHCTQKPSLPPVWKITDLSRAFYHSYGGANSIISYGRSHIVLVHHLPEMWNLGRSSLQRRERFEACESMTICAAPDCRKEFEFTSDEVRSFE